jgi:hypothetical protein
VRTGWNRRIAVLFDGERRTFELPPTTITTWDVEIPADERAILEAIDAARIREIERRRRQAH